MKQILKMVACLSGWLALITSASAQNICVDSPTVTDSQCLLQGTTNSLGILSYTNLAVCIGVPIARPTATATTFHNGSSARNVSHSCPDYYYLDGWVTNAETYVAGTVYFVPPIPASFAAATNFQCTAKVDGIDQQGFCSNIVGIVLGTVTVTCSACDVTETNCSGSTPTLLGYWNFNAPTSLWSGESNANDTISTNDGTWHGTAAYTSGVVGNAFYFDGSSYVSCGTNFGNFGTNDFAVDFWLNTTQGGRTPIVSKWPVCNLSSMWSIRLIDGHIYIETIGNSSGYAFTTLVSDSIVNDGAFHHVTFTRQGTLQTLYIDDEFDNSALSSAIADLNNDVELLVGQSVCVCCDGTANFVGAIDELSIVNGSTSAWAGDRGQNPLAVSNVQQIVSPWGNGLRVNSATNSRLSYRYIDEDGIANINCKSGSVQFWIKPSWNGGTGPGSAGRLIEMGDTNSLSGWWSLWVNASGNQLSFQTKSNGNLTTYFTQSIADWNSNYWYQIVLNYAADQTSLYTNGIIAQIGAGVTNYPSLTARLAHGFSIGSDYSGGSRSAARFDELATFCSPLSADQILDDFILDVLIKGRGHELDNYQDWIFNLGTYRSPGSGAPTLDVYTPIK